MQMPSLYTLVLKNLKNERIEVIQLIDINFKDAFSRSLNIVENKSKDDYELSSWGCLSAIDISREFLSFMLENDKEKVLELVKRHANDRDILDFVTQIVNRDRSVSSKNTVEKTTKKKSVTKKMTPSNHLMKKILDECNIKLFNKSKSKLKKNEIRYIRDKLNIK